MTYAPACVRGARNYLISRGIPGESLGIVGDQSHQSSGGYHVGNDVLALIGKLNTDYSKRESSRDRPGSDAAMALDIGGLSDSELWAISSWIVGQCQAGAPWTQDIREVIYWHMPSNTIRRWDRLGIRTSGDWSHRTHTHLSYHRDSEGRDKTELFRRYYEPLLFVVPESTPAPEIEEDEDMKGIVVFHSAVTGRPQEYALLVPGLPPIKTPDEAVGTQWVIQNHGPSGAAINYGASVANYDAIVATYAALVA